MAPTTRYVQQNLFNVNHKPLEVKTLLETELTEELVLQLIGEPPSNHSTTIGLSGGYTSSGILNSLAVSINPRIVLIQFKAKTKADETAVVTARKLLSDTILCRPNAVLYAFDMGPLALALYDDHSLLIEAGVDIQSACSCESPRIPLQAMKFMVKSTQAAKIYPDNIRDVFASPVRSLEKPETSHALAMRAWLASYVPTLGDMEERLREVPRINTKSIPTDRLLMLAQFTRTSQIQDSSRPQRTAHDFTAITAIDKKFKLESERFQTRLRNQGSGTPSQIELAVKDQYGGEFVTQAKPHTVNGRQGTLVVSGTIEGKTVTAIASVDSDGQTMAEQHRDASILAILQGTSPLFENPFLRTIWPDLEEVVWPEEKFPTHDTPPPLSYQYPLNESQQSAVEAMLTLTDDSRLVLVQGPPGTGKTTVIGAFVQSAVDAEWDGIWLLAQSNVAVKNIAEKLDKIGFNDFRLLVSKDFHLGWHEHLYHSISRNIVRSDDIKKAARELKGVKVILCTLSMLSNPRIDIITSKVPLKYMVVDEASQIAVSDYIAPLEAFSTLQKICFIGDDKQLPPYGQDEIPDLQSIFEISHFREKALFLDIQYRMPPHIGDMISAAVYDGQLHSNPEHGVSGLASFFVDVDGATEKQQKTSWEVGKY
ncbi:P-loop containing nucleoside triphosphate hydrolase protein [Irpex rosettiformis]|uniref:P-loop containing nucleoside triphosphate hydrolase protein n=1 Tax=Irpex rosettiformis TaxID=378272 RepID=A0ACB8UAT3_9APHY|nr:P-loop containing nucleoside triphosphate hydrolase protein [Irpex rosettiformis]